MDFYKPKFYRSHFGFSMISFSSNDITDFIKELLIQINQTVSDDIIIHENDNRFAVYQPLEITGYIIANFNKSENKLYIDLVSMKSYNYNFVRDLIDTFFRESEANCDKIIETKL